MTAPELAHDYNPSHLSRFQRVGRLAHSIGERLMEELSHSSVLGSVVKAYAGVSAGSALVTGPATNLAELYAHKVLASIDQKPGVGEGFEITQLLNADEIDATGEPIRKPLPRQ